MYKNKCMYVNRIKRIKKTEALFFRKTTSRMTKIE